MDEQIETIVIVGHGAAGLTAALSAAERARTIGGRIRILLVERTSPAAAGGGTRFSPSNMRLGDPEKMRTEFAPMLEEESRYEGEYFHALAEHCASTIDWLERYGVVFEQIPYYLAATPRFRPVGGGAALIERLTEQARQTGVEFVYDFTVHNIVREAGGRITALQGANSTGTTVDLPCDAIVLACGGFQGNSAELRHHFGPGGEDLKPISPGSACNGGAGISMALAMGARSAGDWKGMHCEPIDPRSTKPAPVVLLYPFGIVVDQSGRRFFDEGAGLVHETWEEFARAIHFNTPGRIAYAILDSRVDDIPDYGRAIRSDVEPIRANTIRELAERLAVPMEALYLTIRDFNASIPQIDSSFDSSCPDALATVSSLHPPKSNWARAINKPPYIAFPLVCGIAYTFGGLATDTSARVLGAKGPIRGLYAAGEITGHFYGRAPNAVSVLRALVFGRIAGRTCVEELQDIAS